MESYFLVHLLYYEEGLGAAASEIHFIQVPEIQVCMSVNLLETFRFEDENDYDYEI